RARARQARPRSRRGIHQGHGASVARVAPGARCSPCKGVTRIRLGSIVAGQRAPLCMVATMESPAATPNQRILAGILFMCGAGLLFPIMSGFAKFLGESGCSSLQVSWARAFGHIVFMLAFF